MMLKTLLNSCESLFPTCEANMTIIDSWKKKKNRRRGDSVWVYGWSALIAVPAHHYDNDGFSILIRMPPDLERGSFQVWNMNFWNFYKGHTGGFEVLLHSKHWSGGDRTDRHSFLIVAERLTSPEYRKFLDFRDKISKKSKISTKF